MIYLKKQTQLQHKTITINNK